METTVERFVCDLAADGRVACRRGRRLSTDVGQITVRLTVQRGDREALKAAEEAAGDFFKENQEWTQVEVSVED